MKGVKFLPTLKNTIKNFSFGSFIYPVLFSIFIGFILEFGMEFKYIIILSSVFILSYVFTCFLFVLNGLYKKIYNFILVLAVVSLIIPFIPKLNILNIINSSLWYISSFLVFHRLFYSIYNSIFSLKRKIKIQQILFINYQKTWLWIRNLQMSSSRLLLLNILLLTILLSFEYIDALNFSISKDTIVKINVTIYALILPLSLAIVTSNEYSKISKYYVELYQGWNLLFFLSYIFIIFISIINPHNIVSILSVFMIVNTFVFILNLTKQTSSEKIVGRLFGKLENEINKGNYSFIKSTKSKFNWSKIKGFNITTGIIERNKEFEYNIDLLNQLATKAIQNKDRDTFTKIIRGYLKLSRFFLRICKKDKDKVSNLLFQIQTLSLQSKRKPFLEKLSRKCGARAKLNRENEES